MTSAINTGSIDANYPVPGVNNSSQGFRTNFASIKTNLDAAASEITELQNKSILKTALEGTVLNNDMGNGLISNATTLGFSQVAYHLGGGITGTLTIDKSKGDYLYGTATGNITSMAFANWGPSGNYSAVTVSLSVQPNNTIAIPGVVSSNSLATIEGVVGNVIVVPANTYQLTYVFSTTDCGNTVQIAPVDRPRQATQVFSRGLSAANAVSTRGMPGDRPGYVAYSNGSLWLCNGNYNNSTTIWSSVGSGGAGGTSSIVNGTSNVSIPIASGNISFGVGGISNVIQASNTGVSLFGNTSVGNLTVSGISVLGSNTNVRISGGTNGQVLATDGANNLFWVDQSGGGGGGAGSSSPTQVLFNTGGSVTGNSLFTYSAGILSAPSGNIPALTSSVITATNANISGTANINTLNANSISLSNSLTVTANIVAGNINATGTIRANSITANGTGPVTVNSSTNILLVPGTANSNVVVSGNSGLTLTGNVYFSAPPPGFTTFAGTVGQLYVDTANSKIWINTGAFTWKSVTLT